MGNTPMRVVIDPVTVPGSGFTAAALGEALLNALDRSRTAPPVPRVDLGAGRFWQVTGIKGFAAFSRTFQCVSIDARDPIPEIVKLIRDTDGGCIEPVDQPPLEIPADAPVIQLGEALLSLFSPGLESPAISPVRIVRIPCLMPCRWRLIKSRSSFSDISEQVNSLQYQSGIRFPFLDFYRQRGSRRHPLRKTGGNQWDNFLNTDRRCML